VPVSITELLTLLEALKAGLGDLSAERFYYLARTCLVKDEKFYDRYDRARRALQRRRGCLRESAAPAPRRLLEK